ncbi:MAG: hypothetical protein F4Y47_01890 [Acidobacteriia bacterium]|nr:hypothetical protein [Terriglobia bacterium]MYG03155.1 hypothetical protein [Terriglobia bacterium]MYK12200.1 hypothetical protein [Terriglobia bacterium]
MLAKFLELLRRDRQQPGPELLGRPPIRREKAYAADSGYVYQYTYEGYRAATRSDSVGREFVFECTSDRAARFRLAVFAPDESFAAWERSAGRDLNAVERYAIVKMQLFAILDESEHIRHDGEWPLTAEQVERHVAELDL